MKQLEIKQILVPTDFSETAKLAIEHAGFMARLFKAEINLLHIMKPITSTVPLPELTLNSNNLKILQDAIQARLEVEAEEIKKKNGVEVKTFLNVGGVATGIKEVAEECKADIIIMGTHGVSGFQEFFIGSNAYRAISTVECPVLTVQKHTEKIGFSNILLPIDSSVHTRDKVGAACAIAEKYGSVIHILGCITPEHEGEEKQMEIRIGQVEEYLDKHKIPHRRIMKKGDNLSRLSYDTGKEINADLIVIMSEQEPSSDLFLGPFAQQIVNRSKIPVLTVKPKEHLSQISQMGRSFGSF